VDNFLDYLDISALGDKWKYSFNVIGYKYLSTLSKEKDVVHTDKNTCDKNSYEGYYKSQYKTLKDYLDHEQEFLDMINKVYTEQERTRVTNIPVQKIVWLKNTQILKMCLLSFMMCLLLINLV